MALIGELTFYWLFSGLMAVCTIGITGWVLTFPARSRRGLLPIPAMIGVLILSYAAMGLEFLTIPNPDGQPITTARFLGYFFTYPIIVLYLGWLTESPRRKTLTASLFVCTFLVAVIANWFLEGLLGLLPRLVLLGSLAVVLWHLYRPMTRAAGAVEGERKLAFGKIRNVLALVWILYLFVSITSRQGLGILDQFGGIFLTAYLDVIGHVGFAAIFLRADDGIEALHRTAPSFIEYLRG